MGHFGAKVCPNRPVSGGKLRKFSKSLAVMLVVALISSSAMAAAPAGMLYASGTVNVNGVAVTRSTAVFEGDTVATNANSVGTVSYNGSSVLVNGNSTISISKGTVSISSGSAAVQTSQGLMAQIGRINIAPAAQSARFRVVHNGTSVTISALEQNLNIYDGGRNIQLLAGRTVVLPFVAAATSTVAAQPKQQQSDDHKASTAAVQDQNSTVTTTTQGGGNSTSGTTIGGSVDSGMAPGIIAVVTATISAAITTALALGQSPATPVGP
jgi:hypothetical protein